MTLAVGGDPIIISPSFACHCPRALKVLATATVVGLLTGFLGVGGGFLVVPALVLALGLPMSYAAGTSLVVITDGRRLYGLAGPARAHLTASNSPYDTRLLRRTIMCRTVTCRKCGKTTWAGCGQHVKQVMASVPAAERCAGHPRDQVDSSSRWLRKLFGRG